MGLVDAELAVNPHLQLKVERVEGSITAVTARAPVKGEGLRVTRIERTADPQFFAALLVHAATGTLTADTLAPVERAKLVEIGALLAPACISTPVWFSCDVTNPARDLIPPRLRTSRRADQFTDLVANPTLCYFGRSGPPQEMRGRVRLPNAFHPDRAWIAICDPITGMRCVYSDSPESEVLASLRPGAPVSSVVDDETLQCLFDAGIVQSAAEAAVHDARRRSERAVLATALSERRYVVLTDLLPPFQLAAVRQYYRTLIAEGFLQLGDAEWPDRYFSGRDPIGYFFHEQLAAVVSEFAGQRVKASFSFFASYRPGSALPPHRDRDQCEYALSIPLDQSPEPPDTLTWPLHMQPPGADCPTPIYTGIGDGTLYYGREVRHHRETLTGADYCSFWFLFYVPESFDGPLD